MSELRFPPSAPDVTPTLPADCPRPVAWARPWSITAPLARKALRAGAWYPVIDNSRTDGSVILVLKNRNVRVPTRLVELRRQRPDKFTVVYRGPLDTNPAVGTRRDVGRIYGVCPASGHRVRLHGPETRIECPGCGYRGEVAWHETG
jgi:hypothetical protein